MQYINTSNKKKLYKNDRRFLKAQWESNKTIRIFQWFWGFIHYNRQSESNTLDIEHWWNQILKWENIYQLKYDMVNYKTSPSAYSLILNYM